MSQLDAYCLEVDPFDTDRLLFAFTNKVYHFKTRTFTSHFKFDYALTNCGREWREPSAAQLQKVRDSARNGGGRWAERARGEWERRWATAVKIGVRAAWWARDS